MRENYVTRIILTSVFTFIISMVFGSITISQAANEIAREGRFIAYDDGTVLDTKTSLLWSAKDDGKGMDKKDATAYFANYRGGGYTDWRMPSIEELESIYDPEKQNKHGFHVTRLINISGEWVWCLERLGSSTSFNFVDGSTPLAFFEGPGSGSWYSKEKPLSVKHRALPVRHVDKSDKKHLAIHLRKETDAEGLIKPSQPTEKLSTNISIDIAVFPWIFDWVRWYWVNKKQVTGWAIDGFDLFFTEYKSTVLKYSYYDFSNAGKIKDKPLTEDFYNDIWVKKSFFSKREPNLDLIIRLGKQLDFDAVLLLSILTGGFEQDANINLIDIETGKVYSNTGKLWPDITVRDDLKFYTEKLFVNYVNEKYRSHPNYEMIFWDFIKDTQTIEVLESYLTEFPNGTFSKEAKDKIASISKSKPLKARKKKL